MTTRVAVYGSLKQGFPNARLLKDQEFVGNVHTAPTYTLHAVGKGFPALNPIGDTAVFCEIYDVDDFCLQRLDHLEGHPDFYKREQIETELGRVWIYFGKGQLLEGEVITSGNWQTKGY